MSPKNLYTLAAAVMMTVILGSSVAVAQDGAGTRERTRAPKALFKSWGLTISPGVMHPYTDTRSRDFFGSVEPKNENQWGVKGQLTKMLTGGFGIQGQVIYGQLVGVMDTTLMSTERRTLFDHSTDINGQQLNPSYYFKTDMLEVGANIYWNISNTVFNLNRHYRKQQGTNASDVRRASVYMTAGVAYSYYDTKAFDLTTDNELPQDFGVTTSGLASSLTFPVGLGAKIKLNDDLDLGVETSIHFLTSDKLDGLITDFRGRNDKYSHSGVSLTYKMGSKDKRDHLEWKNPLEEVIEDFARLEKKVDRLTSDRDDDGVADYFDKDNETPEGVAVTGGGIAMDADYDGVPDNMDLEPFSDKDAIVDDFGKSLDTDGDGVPDTRDLEPNSPEGDIVNFQGKSIRNSLVQGKRISTGSVGAGLPSIFFELAVSKVDRESEFKLFEVARILKKNPDMKLMVIGNTDERGSEDFNMELGQKRAQNVANYLIENYNIPSSRLEVISRGEAEAATTRHMINRRVDFQLAD